LPLPLGEVPSDSEAERALILVLSLRHGYRRATFLEREARGCPMVGGVGAVAHNGPGRCG